MSTTISVDAFPGPDEVEGFWSWDKMHAPRPITPLSSELIPTTLSAGFTSAQAEYDCPVVVQHWIVNYYYYVAFKPHDDAGVIADRLSRYRETLDDKVPFVGPRWENEWKPGLIKLIEENKRADWTKLGDEELLSKFDWFINHMQYQWYVHGHINFAILGAASFCDFYDALIKPTDTTESYQCLQGFRTRSVDATQALWNLSRTVRKSPELSKLFETTGPKELLGHLDRTADGKAFLEDFDRFLFEFGWRSDAVYDLADITWREDPSIPLAALMGYVSLPDSDNPERHFERSVARREELLAKCRERLAKEPEKLARFEVLYDAARYNLPLTEDHAFWIDQSGIAVFRRFVLEMGRRLAERGSIAQAEDVHYLWQAELRDAIKNRTNYHKVAAARRAEMAEWAKIIPPPILGTPPPPAEDPFMDALVVRLLGVTPPEENPDPMLLKGVAGSAGVITGTARVVRSLAEASALEEGEIVVCEMTLPPWVPLFSIAGAFVTDTGGVLSHCAIVAREFGLPAVVGTQFGTSAIRNGQTITVDGDKGVVRIHAA